MAIFDVIHQHGFKALSFIDHGLRKVLLNFGMPVVGEVFKPTEFRRMGRGCLIEDAA